MRAVCVYGSRILSSFEMWLQETEINSVLNLNHGAASRHHMIFLVHNIALKSRRLTCFRIAYVHNRLLLKRMGSTTFGSRMRQSPGTLCRQSSERYGMRRVNGTFLLPFHFPFL